MTMKTAPAKPKSLDKKQISIEEIVESLKDVGDDVEQIVKLTSKEKRLVANFLEVLKQVPQQMFSIAVSTSELPIGTGTFTQAHIDSTGHLILSSENGQLQVLDLSETKNRNLMMAVVGDIMPKFKDFASQIAEEKLQKPSKVKDSSPPEPRPTINVQEEVPVGLTDSDTQLGHEEVPIDLTDSDAECVPEEVPVVSVEENAKIEEITAETLEYLEMLGNEVFDQSPVSVYFDDWLVNLQQVMLAFESNEAINVDEIFTDECEQIYNDIEEELANRLLNEAELEASAKTVAEKKYILRKMDDEYDAQTKNLQVRGKSAIDFLIKNVQRLEEELEKTQQIKTLNPIKKIALKQKQYTLTQKLKAAKQRLSLAMQNSAVEPKKLDVIDSEYATQTKEIEVNKKSSMDELIENVRQLEEELAKIQQIKTLNPIKKMSQDKKRLEVTEELNAAKQRLALAAQTSEVEQKKIRAEYEKKKQATIKKVQNLEKQIERKKTDGSIKARKTATKALANAVKSLIQRKTAPAQ
ncbi:MAG: hypothetical protein NWF06_01290 [Candidatus Bathyarchaeota archaeon]|nr:hypothetical protein [Candidatus Bathyarchaeum sp.]